MMTLQPSWSSLQVMPLPIPLDEAVTMATLSFINKYYSIMHDDTIEKFVLPQPNIQTFSGFSAEVIHSAVLPSDGFINKYDHQNQFLAIGCNEGHKCLYSLKEKKMEKEIDDPSEIPVTCLRWRPSSESKSKVLGVGNSEGQFEYWHVPSMKKLFTVDEKENSILCCDFSKTGEHFATAGKDSDIRIYDEETKSITTKLGRADWNNKGHANRIFCVKFVDENTLISGGWDSVIHMWDLRQGKSINSFYGPHVSGDSIDLKNNQVLIGCYAAKNQLQIWDLRNQQQLQAIDWGCEKNQVAYVYSCCFSPSDPKCIIAGACGVNEVRIFSGEGKHSTGVRLFDLKHGCFTVDASHSQNQIAFCTAKQGFYVCKFDQR